MLTKAVWVLNIDNYAPEITSFTYPYIKWWANKIDAEFREITERKWPEAPATYEKLQLHTLGEGYDWNIYIDADALIHPDMFDPTAHLYPDTVMQYGNDHTGTRFKDNKYFRRDTRRISSCNWFTIASKDCLDLWHPLEDMTVEEAKHNFHPQLKELATCNDEHLIDDYVLSLNIAKYGLRYTTFLKMLRHLGSEGAQFFFHSHLLTRKEKAYVLPRVMHELWNKATPITAEWLEKATATANAEAPMALGTNAGAQKKRKNKKAKKRKR